jgi:hypothetical protein
MTTFAKLLARKQQLVERLQQEDLGPHERDEIERLLAEIDTALDLLDETQPGELRSRPGMTTTIQNKKTRRDCPVASNFCFSLVQAPRAPRCKASRA